MTHRHERNPKSFRRKRVNVTAYADDIKRLVMGKVSQRISEIMGAHWKEITVETETRVLEVNRGKLTFSNITRRYKIQKFMLPKLR